MIIDILGTGPSLKFYDWSSDNEKWTVGAAAKCLFDGGKDIDIFFCFHKGHADDNQDFIRDKYKKSKIIDNENYPLEEIISRFKSKYFTNSISYMIALAITKKPEKIRFAGVDMALYSEYAFERPSVSFWAGIAMANGIEIEMEMVTPNYLYGYEKEEMDKILEILKKEKISAVIERDHENGKGKDLNQRKLDQWTGYIFALDCIERKVKS